MTSDDYIYTQVTNAVRTVYTSCYRSGRFEPIIERFPAIYVVKVGNERTYQGTDLEFSDKQHRVTYQVDVYTSGEDAMSKAENMIALAENAFSLMFFRMTSSLPTPTTDPTTYRITARYERMVCGNELQPPTPPSNTEEN